LKKNSFRENSLLLGGGVGCVILFVVTAAVEPKEMLHKRTRQFDSWKDAKN